MTQKKGLVDVRWSSADFIHYSFQRSAQKIMANLYYRQMQAMMEALVIKQPRLFDLAHRYFKTILDPTLHDNWPKLEDLRPLYSPVLSPNRLPLFL